MKFGGLMVFSIEVYNLHPVVRLRVLRGRAFGQDHEIPDDLVILQPFPGVTLPVIGMSGLMHGEDSIGELEVLTGRLTGAHGGDPPG